MNISNMEVKDFYTHTSVMSNKQSQLTCASNVFDASIYI